MTTSEENTPIPGTEATSPLEVTDHGPAAQSSLAPKNSHTRTILEIVGAAVAVVLILVAGVGGFFAGVLAAGDGGDHDFGRAVAEERMNDGQMNGGRTNDGPGDRGFGPGMGDFDGDGPGRDHRRGPNGPGDMDFDDMPMHEVPGDMGDMMGDLPPWPPSETMPQPSPAS